MSKRKPPGKPPSQRRRHDGPDDRPDYLPVKAIEQAEVRDSIKDADIILGVDNHTGEEALFYGESMLKRIVRTDQAESAKVMRFGLDFSMSELEYLCAAVMILKGSCCYRSGDQPPLVRGDIN
jgi:hypothetical protein